MENNTLILHKFVEENVKKIENVSVNKKIDFHDIHMTSNNNESDISNTVVSDECDNKIIFPNIENITKFLRNVCSDIHTISGETKPSSININELAKKISNDFPRNNNGRTKPVKEDKFINNIADHLVTLSSHHYYYGTMSSHVLVNRLHALTQESIKEVADKLYNRTMDGEHIPLIEKELYEIIMNNHEKIQKHLQMNNDFKMDYFGLKTMMESYLMKNRDCEFGIIERPQHMFMRMALGIHKDDINSAIETYKLVSNKYFTHATPTLFNSGTPIQQLSSCFLLTVEDDIESIFKMIYEIALISKWSGGIGISLSNLRSKGSLIRKTNGIASGIIPLCGTLNKVAKYINQGGKRKGSIACFTENTEVFTTNEGVKKIKDVKIGDLVVTHMNRVRPVIQVHKNPLGDRKIYKLEVQGNNDIYVTGNHRFWSICPGRKNPGWNSIEDIKNIGKSFISIPNTTNVENADNYSINVVDYVDSINLTKQNSVNKVWKITEYFAYVIGLWFGKGDLSLTDGEPQGIFFRLDDISDENEFELIKRVCQETFNCDISYSGKKFGVESCVIGEVFMKLFGENKKYIPNTIFSWSPNLIKSLIHGFINDCNTVKNKDSVTLNISDEQLAKQLYHLCRNNGMNVSYPHESSDLMKKIGKLYQLSISLSGSEEINIFLEVLNVTETNRNDEYVYTLGVEEDHSYAVEGLLAENCYLEPWHGDIFEFCELKLNTGDEDNRARDLFLALWIPSLFLERVREDGMWSLMCPDKCKGLTDVHSDEFVELYEKYESEKKYIRRVKARQLWIHIMKSISETSSPYILYKDNANMKSNQKNLGTIKCSNLCAEIIEYTSPDEIAVCNLASICLPTFIATDKKRKHFDYGKLIEVCRVIVRNMNKIIDINFYSSEMGKKSNLRNRPIGIGVQGLADLYNIMGFAYDSPEAMDLNKRVFETIYYACLDESAEISKKSGPYETFKGSPFSEGKLQYHLWGKTEKDLLMGYNWNSLIKKIKKYGTRNSLLTAIMPTASTSQLMGNSECIEPYASNIFTRSTQAGNFIIVNKNLMKELIKLGLWNEDMRKRIIIEEGSVQNIETIPENIKKTYRTAYEISQKKMIIQSAERGIFIDQSQSFNVFMKEPNFNTLNSILFDGHDMGLKTGIYYNRTLSAVNPINYGIDIHDIIRLNGSSVKEIVNNMYKNKKDDGGEKDYVKTCKWNPNPVGKIEDCILCGA
jgi:ribonucleoside-diphosphate reductase alpha subunit